jgi:hypothetical protein
VSAATMEAGRELDALVAVRVMGFDAAHPTLAKMGKAIRPYPLGNGVDVPHYSTDIAAAWQVVEKLHAGGVFLMLEQCQSREQYEYDDEVGGANDRCAEAGEWLAHFQNVVGLGSATGATAALAICGAALMAVGHHD